MNISTYMPRLRLAVIAGLASLLMAISGCKSNPPVSDATLTQSVQNQIAADSSLAGQPLQANVQNAVATLNGTVANDAQRTIAARDAAGVTGIKEVINQISVAPQAAMAATPLPAPAPVPAKPLTANAPAKPTREQLCEQAREQARQQAYEQQQEQARNQQRQQPAPIERQQQTYNAPPPPPVAPPAPAFRNVTVPAGNTLAVRVTQTLDSANSQPGDTFTGVIASDVLVDGLVAIPAGASVTGRVDEVHEASHFKGSSLLTVSLTGVSRRGDRMEISTDPYTVQGKGRGTNTAEKVGGGAAVGAILGGIFGGGKGAAIGAGAGGGLGAGAQAVTRGQQVQIPSETVVRFHLTTPVSVRVRTDNGGNTGNGDLQRRNNQ